MIQSGVLEPAPLTPSFISPLFIVTKSNGKNRVIFNLKALKAAHTRAALEFLTSLGWNINREKSILVPSKSMEFLGIVWDTRFNTKFLPPDKVSKIRQYILTRLAAGSWSLKQAQRLLGYFNFATFITHRGRLHCRTLQRHSRQLQKQPRRFEQFTEEVRLELEWWLENVSQKSPIHRESLPINYVVTDASDVRRCALVNNDMLQGTWTRRQRNWHCNLKEMYAVIAAISDNRTVVSYIKNEGGTRSAKLLEMTKQLLALTDSLNAVLVPHHLPGRYNTEADYLSRNRAGSEWHLLNEATEKVFNLWGTPDIDLFASSEAHVVSSYATLDLPDSNACFHDAFSKCWRFDLAWVFPPPALLPRVLHHLNSATGKYIIVAPKWTKPFWRPDLKSRALARPVKMKNLTTTLIDTATGRPPAQVHNLQLEAWLISAGTL
ncbi:hypothetical protein ABMA27_010815 [Loxostege sticticalis]|uniref:Uncharacterized protein n=1 Tax=Loxostege sticticalis TaxID=481309 RepID=A0ABR3H4H2_LOXSC